MKTLIYNKIKIYFKDIKQEKEFDSLEFLAEKYNITGNNIAKFYKDDILVFVIGNLILDYDKKSDLITTNIEEYLLLRNTNDYDKFMKEIV